MADWMTDVQIAPAESGELLMAVADLTELPASSTTLDVYLNKLERFGELAGELGYAGLQEACLLLQEMIQARYVADDGLDQEVRIALDVWPELVRRYLDSSPEEGPAEALTDHLQLPVWLSPLTSNDASMVQMLLLEERQQAPFLAEEAESLKVQDDPPEPEVFVATAVVSEQPDREEDERWSEEPAEEVLPPQANELIEVLLAEIPFLEAPLENLLEMEMSAEGVPEGREEACEAYDDYLERFADAADAVGFSGLRRAVSLMRENLGLLAIQSRSFTSDEMDLLAAWSGYTSVYLSAPHDKFACQGLIEWLQAPGWPLPLAEEEAETLLALLQAPTLAQAEEDEIAVARPETAGPDDVSLELPEDVNIELLEALLQELPSQTETFSAAIQNLINGGSPEDVNTAQRTAHTVKGAGNTVGVYGLANLTHHLEDILAALAKQKALPTRSLALSLMSAADCLEAMGEALSGIGEPPDDARAVLQEVLDWANRIDREGLPSADDETPPALVVTPAPEPASGLAALPVKEHSAEGTQQLQAATSPPMATTRVSTGLVDDLLRLGGETIILNGQVHEQVRRIEERIRAMHTEFDRLQRLGGDLERLIDIRDLSTDLRRQQQSSEFDSLEMDQYSELHTTSRMLVEAATDSRQIGSIVSDQLQQLEATLLNQERLNRETQEKVLSARMVPIRSMVSRLQRSVRQTCRLTGKKVELHISGADTLMDGEVLNELIDPLMHVLRNAVDHGIESAEQRLVVGKPGTGNIRLDFLREGNNILVRCRDDGAGFDYEAIRRAAESRDLLEPGKAASDEELRNLLLTPNFSTRSEVTQTSGRGVGLDAVYSHVLSHGGALALKSETGKGSSTELRLPVSLISTHALLVQVRDQMMAVADHGIERILHAGDGKQHSFGDQATFQVDEHMYPLRSLDDILRLAPDRRASERGPMPVLLVRSRSGVTAVPVQEVLAGTDLVIKEFGRYVPPVTGIVGATILGNGAVTPVLDLPELINRVRGKAAESATETVQESPSLPLALVVDDSLSARRALVQVMADAGYDVREARDGHEAVQIVEARCPEVVLVDMEMPRMNGIELTSHLRTRPETADLPVIMITSRSTAKHRQQAKEAGANVYLTKPFLDDELIDHVARLRGQI